MSTRSARISSPVACGLGACLLFASSCRQIASVEEHAACEDLEARVEGCTNCQRAECCDEALACEADADCRALDACMAGCSSDDACRTKCGESHAPALRGPFASLASCRARACPAECSRACGGFVYRDTECAACTEAACCAEAAACAQSAECLGLSYCERVCSAHDAACLGDCERRHPNGMPAAQAFGRCVAVACAAECGLGPEPDWSCVDQPLSPPGSDLLTLDVYVRKLVEWSWATEQGAKNDALGEAIEGAGVRLCQYQKNNVGPPGCSETVTLTDQTGRARLEVPSGFGGWVRIQSDGIAETHAHVSPPMVDDRSISVLAFTPEAFETFFGPLGADPTRGHVTLRAVDCQQRDAAGVSFSLEHDVQSASATGLEPYYGFSADNPGAATTSGKGSGGFINVPEGDYLVVATRRDTSECVAMRKIRVYDGARTNVDPLFPGGCKP